MIARFNFKIKLNLPAAFFFSLKFQMKMLNDCGNWIRFEICFVMEMLFFVCDYFVRIIRWTILINLLNIPSDFVLP